MIVRAATVEDIDAINKFFADGKGNARK